MFELLTRHRKKKYQKEAVKKLQNNMRKAADTFEQRFANIKISFDKTLDELEDGLDFSSGVLIDRNADTRSTGAFCFVNRGKKVYCASRNRHTTAHATCNITPLVNSNATYNSYYFPRLILVPKSREHYLYLDHFSTYPVGCTYKEALRLSLQKDYKYPKKVLITEPADGFQNMMMKVRHGAEVGPTLEHALSDKSMKTDKSDLLQMILQNSQISTTFSITNKYPCKHGYIREDSNKVYMPRSFQHHLLTAPLKTLYEDTQGYSLRKNYQCPPSRCCALGPKDEVELINMAGPVVNDIDLVTWRYSRTQKVKKSGPSKCYTITEYMCRYCKEKTWVSNRRYFEHLFKAHGILTSLNTSFTKTEGDNFTIVKDVHYGNGRTCMNNSDITGESCTHDESERDSDSDFDIVINNNENNNSKLLSKCKITNPSQFLNRNILPNLSVKLLPLPLKMFQEITTRETHIEKRL
ncbi:hypothetical protein ACO0QE_000800 [Hanseniaspora vineae]